MNTTPTSLFVSILTSEDDLAGVCRRLATEANPSAMHLSRAVVTGTQIYPVRLDTLHGTSAVLTCEFRMRNPQASLTVEIARDVLDRIRARHIIEAYLTDARGDRSPLLHDLAAAS